MFSRKNPTVIQECDCYMKNVMPFLICLFVCIIIMQIPKPFEECTLHLMATLGILYKISLGKFSKIHFPNAEITKQQYCQIVV